MTHELSTADREFVAELESCRYPLASFDHRAHVRLAYAYLAEHDDEIAYQRVRSTIQRLLAHHGIDPSKYHDTMTRAWVLAVRHFLGQSARSTCADDFIGQHPVLLDSKIMLTHYSAGRLFAAEARAGFVEPDLDPIPRSTPRR